MKKVEIYSDGACSGNPGPGGYGAILKYGDTIKEISKGFLDTTNNRMELLGAIDALKMLKSPCEVDLYSDSKYIVDAINKGWAVSWRQKNWMRTKKEKAKNIDLWEQMLELCDIHKINFIWVKGHSTNKFNNRCDELAVLARESIAIKN